MPKHFLEDMVIVKHEKKHASKIKPIKINQIADSGIKPSLNKYRYMIWLVALISAIFCFFAFSIFFSKAEVLVNVKTKDIVLNKNLPASFDLSVDTLSFELTHFSGDASKTIYLEEKDFNEKAKGKIILYNKFSSFSQTLEAGTRLLGSNNKIYKIKTKVVIPGINKDKIPGQASVDIYAEKEGADYNSTSLDFKIVNFKGSPKYEKFYGRSVGDITGGIVGKSHQVSDLQKIEIEKELKITLENKLFNEISSQIPGFLLYKDATSLKIDDFLISPVSADGSVVVTIRGTLYGIIFNEHNLTQKIAKDSIDKFDGSKVYIPNIKDLTFSILNKENILFDSVKNINFNLSGPVKIVWELDTDKFIIELLNKPKNNFNQILSQYPNIDSILVKLNPPWIQSLPSKIENIKVTVDYLK